MPQTHLRAPSGKMKSQFSIETCVQTRSKVLYRSQFVSNPNYYDPLLYGASSPGPLLSDGLHA